MIARRGGGDLRGVEPSSEGGKIDSDPRGVLIRPPKPARARRSSPGRRWAAAQHPPRAGRRPALPACLRPADVDRQHLKAMPKTRRHDRRIVTPPPQTRTCSGGDGRWSIRRRPRPRARRQAWRPHLRRQAPQPPATGPRNIPVQRFRRGAREIGWRRNHRRWRIGAALTQRAASSAPSRARITSLIGALAEPVSKASSPVRPAADGSTRSGCNPAGLAQPGAGAIVLAHGPVGTGPVEERRKRRALPA